MRSRSGGRRRQSNLVTAHDVLIRSASLRWRTFTQAQRDRWQQFAVRKASAVIGDKRDDSDAGRRAFLDHYIFAQLTAALGTSPTDGQLEPYIGAAPASLRTFVLSYPAAGAIRLSASKVVSGTIYGRGLLIGPYAKTTRFRPSGFNARRAVVTSAATTLPVILNWAGLNSNVIYFIRARYICSTSGLLIVNEAEYRAETT